MIPKPLGEIEWSDLVALLDGRVPESERLDYKSQLPGGSDTAKINFAKDVTALANAHGGDLIFGIEDADGVPIAIPGIGQVNEESELNRLDSLARSGAEPRLPHVAIRSVRGPAGELVAILRIARSWFGPHRAIVAGHNRFWARGANSNFEMNWMQIRDAFLGRSSALDGYRQWRESRLSAIRNGAAPFPVTSPAAAALHIASVDSFAAPSVLAASDLESQDFRSVSHYSELTRSRINFDGVYRATPFDERGRVAEYVQVFRSGAIEAVTAFAAVSQDEGRSSPRLRLRWLEQEGTGCALQNIRSVSSLGLGPPFAVGISLLRASGAVPDLESEYVERQIRAVPVDRPDLVVPASIVEEESEEKVASIVRDQVSALWNACGILECPPQLRARERL